MSTRTLQTLPPELHIQIVREVLWASVETPPNEVRRRDWHPSHRRNLLAHPFRRREPLFPITYERRERTEPFLEPEDEIKLADAAVILMEVLPVWRRVCEAMRAEAVALDARGDASGPFQLGKPASDKVRLLQLHATHATPAAARHAPALMQAPLRPFEKALLAFASKAAVLRAIALTGYCSDILPAILDSLPGRHGQITELSFAPSESTIAALVKCTNVHTLELGPNKAMTELVGFWDAPPFRVVFAAVAALPRLRSLALIQLHFRNYAYGDYMDLSQLKRAAPLEKVVLHDLDCIGARLLCQIVVPFAKTLVHFEASEHFSSPAEPLSLPAFPKLQHVRVRRSVTSIAIAARELEHYLNLIRHSPIVSLSLDGIDLQSPQTLYSQLAPKLSTLRTLQVLDNPKVELPGRRIGTARRHWTEAEMERWVGKLEAAGVRCDVALWWDDELILC